MLKSSDTIMNYCNKKGIVEHTLIKKNEDCLTFLNNKRLKGIINIQ